jgi:hypothetical protein
MKINQYKIHQIPFDADEWEFLHSLIYIRYNKPINVLSIGSGSYSLEYAVATELESNLQSFSSIDVVNNYGLEDSAYYNKRTVYSTIIGRGCENCVAVQNDCLDDGVKDEIENNLKGNKINLLLLEFVKSSGYIDMVMENFKDLFDSQYDVYMHNIDSSEDSRNYFNKMSNDNTSVLIKKTKGIGVIKDVKGIIFEEKISEIKNVVSIL